MSHPPELKKFINKKLSLKLNGSRHVQGILRGFDPFINLAIDECVEMATSGQQNNIRMVVIRGNGIIMLEALEQYKQRLFNREIRVLLPEALFLTMT
uniref:Small nuclear ribonucleoprotein G n=1 Tax=Urocitellus parryii TaxID=9999 RepID=A0A8D2H608_UROPR